MLEPKKIFDEVKRSNISSVRAIELLKSSIEQRYNLKTRAKCVEILMKISNKIIIKKLC